MKKRSLLLSVCLMLVILLLGCGAASESVSGGQDLSPAQEPARPADTAVNDVSDDSSLEELCPPVIEWWELYNPNGFDTLTAVISNPNDTAIEASFDFVYYKDNVEVARSEALFSSGILPGGRNIIWANYDIPKSTDVDDVRMENVTVSEAYYPPIDGTYEYVGTTDGEAFFDFTFESKPQAATIIFLLYSDNNQNGHFDKGEIVVTSIASLLEQTGRVSFETDGFSYTDYEVFFSAY